MIAGVDDKLSTFFPEYKSVFENKDSGKDAICLKHLLAMTAGLGWDEASLPYTDVRNDHVAMNHCEDQIRYVLERPLVAAPGTKFNYSSGISNVLGEIIHKVSGMCADKFAEQHLFKPLGVSDYSWLKTSPRLRSRIERRVCRSARILFRRARRPRSRRHPSSIILRT